MTEEEKTMLQVAMDHLLPPDRRTGDRETDLKAAFRESIRRRDENPADGGAVIMAMRARNEDGGLGWSWLTFTMNTGVSSRSGGHWIKQAASLLKRAT